MTRCALCQERKGKTAYRSPYNFDPEFQPFRGLEDWPLLAGLKECTTCGSLYGWSIDEGDDFFVDYDMYYLHQIDERSTKLVRHFSATGDALREDELIEILKSDALNFSLLEQLAEAYDTHSLLPILQHQHEAGEWISWSLLVASAKEGEDLAWVIPDMRRYLAELIAERDSVVFVVQVLAVFEKAARKGIDMSGLLPELEELAKNNYTSAQRLLDLVRRGS